MIGFVVFALRMMLILPGGMTRANWSETPPALQQDLASRVAALAQRVDAMILLDQVDIAETGVVSGPVAAAARTAHALSPSASFNASGVNSRSHRSQGPR